MTRAHLLCGVAADSRQARKHGKKTACLYRNIVDVVEEVKPVKRSDGTQESKSWK